MFSSTVRLGISLKSWKMKPILLNLAAIQRGQVLTVDEDLAFARTLLQQQQTKECRFAGTARAGQEDEFSFIDSEREVAQRVQTATVNLREVMRLDHVFVRIAYLTTNAQLPRPNPLLIPNFRLQRIPQN
jgi:hypothetical protein